MAVPKYSSDLTIETVKLLALECPQSDRGNTRLKRISRATGIPHPVILAYRDGEKDPSSQNVQHLYEYLSGQKLLDARGQM